MLAEEAELGLENKMRILSMEFQMRPMIPAWGIKEEKEISMLHVNEVEWKKS